MRVEDTGDAVVLSGRGSNPVDLCLAVDVSITEVVEPSKPVVWYHGSRKDGALLDPARDGQRDSTSPRSEG